MIKILAIGNSFSQDATAYMEYFSDEVYVRNLYIGGCNLYKHAELVKSAEKEYEYQHCGERCLPERVSLQEALAFEEWDYITVQQASGYSGIEESYFPYIEQLVAHLKARTKAEIVFHQTWAYEKNSTHPHFEWYAKDRDKMWASIQETTKKVCDKLDLRVIYSGETIERLKDDPFFDIDKGGVSIHRDGFHLSLNYGRFAAACVWLKFFTGKIPEYLQRKDLSQGYALILKELEKL